MQRLERLLTRFEIDVAARVHLVDYQAIIARECDHFHEQMHALMESRTENFSDSTARSRSVSHTVSRAVGRSRHE
jgi:hypothetical protein